MQNFLIILRVDFDQYFRFEYSMQSQNSNIYKIILVKLNPKNDFYHETLYTAV